MRVALVTPISHGPHFNPGCNQITEGIRYLVRRLVPEAVFVPVEMMHDIPEHWEMAATCDVAILCGNPRFTLSGPSFWECDVWYRLAGLQAAGIRVIDGWGGAAHRQDVGMSVEDMARAIINLPRTGHYLRIASKIHRRITRDALMQRIYEWAGIESKLLPCSSWYAAKESGIVPATRQWNAVALYAIPYHEGGIEAVHRMIEQAGEKARVIASTWGDYAWTRAHGIASELMPDAASILRTFAACKRVIAMRLHAAIPAASLGCDVGSISIDSRILTLDPFGLLSIPLDRVGDEPIPFGQATAPDEAAILATLKEALC